MGEVIRWGIWGAGAIAHQLASDFPLISGATLSAIASRNGERAQRFATHYGVKKACGGLQKLIEDPEIDVVYIATPNHLHKDDSIACIEAGKAVLCEKPFALNLAQGKAIAAAARQHNVFCMEAMWTRFIPAVMEAKRAIDSGVIGQVRLVQGNFAYPVATGTENRFFDPQGGGAMLDRGVYLISLAQHLFGQAQSIQASATLAATGVDEQSAYQLTYPNGILAAFAASLRTRGNNEVTISGDLGMLRLCEPFYRAHRLATQSFQAPAAATSNDAPRRGPRNSPALKALRRRLTPVLEFLQRGRVQSFPFPGNGYQFELQHVTDCLRQRRTESAVMPLSDSLEVLRVMDALQSQMHKETATRAI